MQGLGVGCIACGARHSLAITNGGAKVWAWGSNVTGQLGVGMNSASEGYQRTVPSLVAALSNKKGFLITQVIAAANHSLALTQVGEVFAFGSNSHGQLGFRPAGSSEPAATAIGRGPPASQFEQLQQASLSRANVRKTYEMDVPKAYSEGVDVLWLPARVVTLSQYRVRSISSADMHTLIMAES
ncbi:unnamed protein product [Polarella glacialis]|nr:unnamed protein product [Polarella glacialis]